MISAALSLSTSIRRPGCPSRTVTTRRQRQWPPGGMPLPAEPALRLRLWQPQSNWGARGQTSACSVLVTDGFAVEDNYSDVLAKIDEYEIDVIALAIGDEPALDVLAELTSRNDGLLLRVADVAMLPRLVSASGWRPSIDLRFQCHPATTGTPTALFGRN